MTFADFQTDTGTLKKMDTDSYGDQFELDSISVQVDPVFGFKRVYTEEDEEVTGQSTIITTDPISDLQDFWDQTHRNWRLTFEEKDFDADTVTPFYKIGTNDLEHLEFVMR